MVEKFNNTIRSKIIEHPEVIKTTEDNIEFSEKFMNEYLNLVDNRGFSAKQALRTLDFNPDYLDEQKIKSLRVNFILLLKLKERGDKYKYTVYKSPQEELEFYKRYSFRLEHALRLYMQIYKIKSNAKEIEKILKH